MTGKVPLVTEHVCLCFTITGFWQFLLSELCSVLAVGETTKAAFVLPLLTHPGVG